MQSFNYSRNQNFFGDYSNLMKSKIMNKKSEQAHMPHATMLLDNTTRYECHICILVNNKRGLTPKEINKSKYHAIMHCVHLYKVL